MKTKRFAIMIGLLLLVPIGAIAVSIYPYPTSLDIPANVIPVINDTSDSGEIVFGDWIGGTVQYSLNNLTVCNNGTAAYKMFIAGTDYELTGGACPVSNVLNIENVEYFYDGQWNILQQYNINMPCGGSQCRTSSDNLIKEFQPSECVSLPFRRNIPNPCTGTMDYGGEIYILTE